MREFDRQLGQRIYLARQEAGLSQGGLASRIGTTQDAVSLYERGARSVSLDTLISIAKALNKTLGYFLEIHDSLVVVRDSHLYHIIQDIEQYPGDSDLLLEVWQFLKWRRTRHQTD